MKRLLEKLRTFIGFGPSLCSAWRTIEDARPAVGDLIACSAFDESGSRIFWAGHITEQAGKMEVMMLDDDGEPFVVTYDTLWIKIPEPNNQTMVSEGLPSVPGSAPQISD